MSGNKAVAIRFRLKPWGIMLAAILTVGYFTLMAESIECQYFQDRDGHHRTSSHPLRDRIHCIAANHSAAVATLAAGPGHHSLQLLGFLLTSSPVFHGTGVSFPKTARSPPSA
jgi:hypothetical protein